MTDIDKIREDYSPARWRDDPRVLALCDEVEKLRAMEQTARIIWVQTRERAPTEHQWMRLTDALNAYTAAQPQETNDERPLWGSYATAKWDAAQPQETD